MLGMFYHIKNLQSTKTSLNISVPAQRFITLRIYKVLKPNDNSLSKKFRFITLRIYKVLKLTKFFGSVLTVLSH